MCLAPKMPKVDFKEPAPPPPTPEESAAASQGTPEMLFIGRRRASSNKRNKLRIDRNGNDKRNTNIPRLA